MPRLFENLRKKPCYSVQASLAALAFWYLQYIYETSIAGLDANLSLLVSFAYSGATLISIALAVGPLARLTRLNFIKHRRAIAVWGFTFAILHVFSALSFVFAFNISIVFWTLNPLANPIIFGLLAFMIFLPLYITSTDWSVAKMGYKRWKFLHSFVYLGFIFMVLHGLLTNTQRLASVPGIVLLGAFLLAAFLQIFGFSKKILARKSAKQPQAPLQAAPA